MNPDEKAALDLFLKRREEEVRFFASAAKPERERWVVCSFLEALGMTVDKANMRSGPENDDVDVYYEDLCFQVKELSKPGIRRHAELKEDLQRARNARCLDDLFAPVEAEDLVYVDATGTLIGLAGDPKYPRSRRAKLDLLIYVTWPHGYIPVSTRAVLAGLGWRSVSLLYGGRAHVVVASEAAPNLLRSACGGRA